MTCYQLIKTHSKKVSNKNDHYFLKTYIEFGNKNIDTWNGTKS